ncbi:MAG: PIN domain-containing protein [Xanthomonadales bacterium]|nr:PIN domain-containing protein [Xanthomonadales bacterium]
MHDRAGEWRPQPVYLLDVNVLIALLDPMHTQHQRAHQWFASEVTTWASCALTENGYVRIVSQPRYPNALATPTQAVALLADLCARPDHRFWAGEQSLLDGDAIHAERLLSAGQVTDTWLLALAVRHGGMLATFDKRLVSDAVVGGDRALQLIE